MQSWLLLIKFVEFVEQGRAEVGGMGVSLLALLPQLSAPQSEIFGHATVLEVITVSSNSIV